MAIKSIAVCLLLSAAAHAGTITLENVPSEYIPGQTFAIDVRIADVPDLSAYNIELFAEAKTGTLGDVSVFTPLPSAPTNEYLFTGSDLFLTSTRVASSLRHLLILSDFATEGVRLSDGNLVATVPVRIPVTSPVPVELGFEVDGLLLDNADLAPVAEFDAIRSMASSTSFTVNPVPEPAALLMMQCGFLVMSMRHRRTYAGR